MRIYMKKQGTGKRDFSVSSSVPSVNEGDSVTFTVTGQNVPDGTVIPYSITGINAADLSTGALSGSLVINSNTAEYSITLNADEITEDLETITFTIQGTGVTASEIIERSVSVDVNDTSGTPAIEGGAVFRSAGTHTWTAPEGVTSVSAVVVAGGGAGGTANSGAGGGGGALAWKNNISVIPGNTYTVIVGDGGSAPREITGNGGGGGESSFIDTSTLRAIGGSGGSGPSASVETFGGGYYLGDGGGFGGNGGWDTGNWNGGGGGGAGGYTGNGGRGASAQQTNNLLTSPATNGAGGGGGGGGGANTSNWTGAGGGGVGLYGEGLSGTAGLTKNLNSANATGTGGSGGSGGGSGRDGGYGAPDGFNSNVNVPHGGGVGAGGGGFNLGNGYGRAGDGHRGAVRIIWGEGRSFPSTNTGFTLGSEQVNDPVSVSWTAGNTESQVDAIVGTAVKQPYTPNVVPGESYNYYQSSQTIDKLYDGNWTTSGMMVMTGISTFIEPTNYIKIRITLSEIKRIKHIAIGRGQFNGQYNLPSTFSLWKDGVPITGEYQFPVYGDYTTGGYIGDVSYLDRIAVFNVDVIEKEFDIYMTQHTGYPTTSVTEIAVYTEFE